MTLGWRTDEAVVYDCAKMLTPSLRENPSGAVFLLPDADTQGACRLRDLIRAQHIRPVVAQSMPGKFVKKGRHYLVLGSVRPDTRLAWFSNVPVPVGGAGGSAIS
jgi:hypothetical protein